MALIKHVNALLKNKIIVDQPIKSYNIINI